MVPHHRSDSWLELMQCDSRGTNIIKSMSSFCRRTAAVICFPFLRWLRITKTEQRCVDGRHFVGNTSKRNNAEHVDCHLSYLRMRGTTCVNSRSVIICSRVTAVSASVA